MYVRKCRDCDIKYPADMAFSKCRACDRPTAQLVGSIDTDWEARVDKILGAAQQLEADDPIERWRFQELLRAGFGVAEASLLAADRSVELRPTIKLAAKAGPDLAYRIAS